MPAQQAHFSHFHMYSRKYFMSNKHKDHKSGRMNCQRNGNEELNPKLAEITYNFYGPSNKVLVLVYILWRYLSIISFKKSEAISLLSWAHPLRHSLSVCAQVPICPQVFLDIGKFHTKKTIRYICEFC